jgi:hypothetical protein
MNVTDTCFSSLGEAKSFTTEEFIIIFYRLKPHFSTLWFNIFKGNVGRMKRGRKCNTEHYRENEKVG